MKHLYMATIMSMAVLTAGCDKQDEEQGAVSSGVEPIVMPGRPDFSAITNVTEKKEAFFQYLLPYVERENQRIAYERQHLVDYQKKLLRGEVLSSEDDAYAARLAKLYSYSIAGNVSQAWLDEMLIRVDELPPSLVLTQAAKESGWGTSRFAVEGNNYFGQWCYQQGCGLIPNSRNASATHEVALYSSAAESVHAYFMNINRNRAYRYLRSIRAELRLDDEPVTGEALANGLLSYSERGQAYVSEIQSMIRQNANFW
ncbi:glucosaminidase domain-containing protein [Thaumasiovibrio sp. DFM-14]|uniref:glucosaminidase domain-containing protein n=1 Tax=Thaumasiovibrio sp. DFM-14 TaxID=3384792 RepID=UPI0039A1AD08